MIKKTGFSLLLFFSAALIFAQNPTAVIREMTGTVEIKRSASAEWISARAGDTIERATIISTGFRSTAILIIGSSILTVRPLTRLSLDELISLDNTETVNLNLNSGRVRVDVNPPAGSRANLTIQTPSSTASVRGTSFEIDTTSIRVITGSVGYSSASGTAAVTVSAGQESFVNTDTGRTVNPIAAAETNRALPALPGQNTDGGVRSEPYMGSGSLDAEIILTPRN